MKNKTEKFGFENLVVWQKSKELVLLVYGCTKFWPKAEIYGLQSQVNRAAVSVSANLAEGSCRFSRKEQNRFYEIAYGSNIEVLNHMIMSEALGYTTKDRLEEIKSKTLEISKLISGLKNYA